MPRPGPLKHGGQLIVGGGVKRVSNGRGRGQSGKIQQRHEVYPEWLRHRVFPPQGDSMPVFMWGSTSAYLLLGYVDADAQVVFSRAVTRAHTTATPFDVTRLHVLPRVDIVYAYGGADGVLVDA